MVRTFSCRSRSGANRCSTKALPGSKRHLKPEVLSSDAPGDAAFTHALSSGGHAPIPRIPRHKGDGYVMDSDQKGYKEQLMMIDLLIDGAVLSGVSRHDGRSGCAELFQS